MFGKINAARLWASLLALATAAGTPAGAQTPFYQPTIGDLRGPPGSLIRYEELSNPPEGARAYRVLYRSRGLRGEGIAVSGAVFLPTSTAMSPRPIVAWAHPTAGVVPKCAPSLARVLDRSVQGLDEMIERGFIVTATDYPGLGTPGPHPYLVGVSEGRAVIDSVRAARELAGIEASRSFAVWGHSQGGHAALYTGLLARTYAPDLKLVGVATAAPATELATLMKADMDTTGGKNLTAITLWSWARVFGAPIQTVVTPEAMPVVDELANGCIETIWDVLARRAPSAQLEQSFLSVNGIADRQPWKALLDRNTPGTLPRGVPVFIAQGSTDDLVRPEVTSDYVHKLCRAGSRVSTLTVSGVGHAFIGRDSAPAAVAWMADRFARRPAPSSCQ